MNTNLKNAASLFLWVAALLFTGFLIGQMTQPGITDWYQALNKSALTPPDYVFGLVWSILYAMIGYCGWAIWQTQQSTNTKLIFITQLLLNFIWSPLFFYFNQVLLSLIVILILICLVATLMRILSKNQILLTLLLTPYFLWLGFAGYLNAFIWLYN